MRESTLRSPMSDLRKDLYAVARDAEALLKATAEVTNEQVQEIRARTERTLRETLEHLDTERMRTMARQTDTYVREHPWTVVGAAAGLGLLIGLLAGRARNGGGGQSASERFATYDETYDESGREDTQGLTGMG